MSSEAEITVYSIASAMCIFLVLLGAVPSTQLGLATKAALNWSAPLGARKRLRWELGLLGPSNEAFQNPRTRQQALLSSGPQFRPLYSDMSLCDL